MIYSIIIFLLLIIRNYLEKSEKVLVDSMIGQVFIIVMFKNNLGVHAMIVVIMYIGDIVRRMQFGNVDGDRRY